MQLQILIVEDDDDIRETLIDVCQGEGYKVFGAINGRVALDKIKNEIKGSCMVLLDLMMPVMDGKGFLDAFGTELPERKNEISIVVFSAGASVSHPLVKGFLKKPVDLDEVLLMVKKNCEAI